jgi:hypothetical protein
MRNLLLRTAHRVRTVYVGAPVQDYRKDQCCAVKGTAFPVSTSVLSGFTCVVPSRRNVSRKPAVFSCTGMRSKLKGGGGGEACVE